MTVTKCSLVQYSNSRHICAIFSLCHRSKLCHSFIIRILDKTARSPDELHIAGGLHVLLDHLDEERRLRPVLEVSPTSVRNLAQLVDEVDEILQHAPHRFAHVAEQEPSDYPVGVPIVDLSAAGIQSFSPSQPTDPCLLPETSTRNHHGIWEGDERVPVGIGGHVRRHLATEDLPGRVEVAGKLTVVRI